MTAMIRLVCSGFIFPFCVFAPLGAEALQSAADQAYSLFGTQTVTMGRFGGYSRMVGHKTVLLDESKTKVLG